MTFISLAGILDSYVYSGCRSSSIVDCVYLTILDCDDLCV